MTDIPDGWQRVVVDGTPQLEKHFRFDDFAAAMAFANAVAAAAQAADHHPQMIIQWGKVTVRWWSHDVGGISGRDIRLARATDELAP